MARGSNLDTSNNNINIEIFKTAIRQALQMGHSKGSNIILIGPANCGKTFVLNLLTEVFKYFVSPASGTFAWVGAEKADVIFLNNLRRNDKLPCADSLNLSEGLPIHIQAPKTYFAEDILWGVKTPIFATSSTQLRKYDGGVVNEIETNMMMVRWNYFEFCKPVTNPKVIK